jgi:hypothetical protein
MSDKRAERIDTVCVGKAETGVLYVETFTRVILGKYKYWEWTRGLEGKERG